MIRWWLRRWWARRHLDDERIRELEYAAGIRESGFKIVGSFTLVPCQVNVHRPPKETDE